MKWAPTAVIIVLLGAVAVLGSMAVNQKPATGLAVCPVGLNASDTCVFACGVNPELKIPLEAVGNAQSCAVSGKVKVIAFHSPTCQYCEQQTPVLTQLKQKYGDTLDLSYACTTIHTGDDVLCQNDTSGKYLPYAQSQALLTQYQTAIGGTPTLVINCEYARVGSYAIQDPTTEYSDLDKLFSLMLGAQ